jgi:WD40 repeat protein
MAAATPMTNSAAAPPLTLSHIFGLKGDVKDNIHYVDENNVLYPAGYNIVIYDVEKKQQKLLNLSQNSDVATSTTGDITALSMSTFKHPNTKGKLLAVAERGHEKQAARVMVYDLLNLKRKDKASIESKELLSREYVSMCFSPDCKFLLTQGGAPDWTLVNWQWEKARPLQYARVSNQAGAEIHQCSYCPTDPSVVCVTGNGVLRFLHLEQNEFKSIPFSIGKREPQNYLCHCWVEDRILVGTDTGDVLVFENAEFRKVLETSPSDGKSIDSIAAFSKGFVAGCDEGILYVFERDEKEIYKQSKNFLIENNYVRIKNIAISPSEDNVVCTLENNQAFVLGLSNTDILKTEEMNFNPLALPFHHLQITGLDVCLRKPLVVSCGLDRSVRVWNYLKQDIEVMKYFNEPPHSVAFHPSGLHIIVGFSDSLRLCNLLMDEIRPYKDFAIKGCREIRFSNGGMYFAVANGSIVQVYSTYTCEAIASMNAHKGKVRSIWWSPDDTYLLTGGMDGCVYQWILRGTDGPKQLTKEECTITCVQGGPEDQVFAAASDSKLKIAQVGTENHKIKELSAGLVLSQVVVPNFSDKDRLLFAGTETGAVRVFSFPIDGKCYDLQAHSGPITRMVMACNDEYLFTVSDDSCVAVYEISSVVEKKKAPPQWAEEILVTKSDLQEKMDLMTDLQNKVEELQYHNELQLEQRKVAYHENMRDLKEKFTQELEMDKKRYAALEEEKLAMEQDFNDQVGSLNQLQASKLLELRNHHKEKLEAEQLRFQKLKDKKADDDNERKNDRKRREARYKRDRDNLQKDYEERITAEQEKRSEIEKETEAVKGEFEETKTLMEQDADDEIDEMKMGYDEKLTTERENTLKLKDQNFQLKNKFRELKGMITKNLTSLQEMKGQQMDLTDKIKSKEKDITGHLKEIKERESTIEDKVHRIFELRKKNQELEKFKFVLDYKITELKRQIQPRKLEMKQMSEQIRQMQAELKGYKKESVHLQLQVRELGLKLDGMEKEITECTAERKEIEALTGRFKMELHEVFQDIEDPKTLKEGIKRLYQRHVTSDLKTKQTQIDDIHKDYQRQRHYLERSVDSLNMKLTKDMKVHKKDNQRIMQENIALIKEINELRREMKHAKDKQRIAHDDGRSVETGNNTKREMMEREMETQQEQIRALKAQLKVLVEDLSERGVGGTRPDSQQGRLPPLREPLGEDGEPVKQLQLQ